MRTYIHHTLQKPQVLHPGVSAVWTDGAYVGYCLTEINAGILEAIYAGKNLRRDHAPDRLVVRICAAIVDVARESRGNRAVSVARIPGGPERAVPSMRA